MLPRRREERKSGGFSSISLEMTILVILGVGECLGSWEGWGLETDRIAG